MRVRIARLALADKFVVLWADSLSCIVRVEHIHVNALFNRDLASIIGRRQATLDHAIVGENHLLAILMDRRALTIGIHVYRVISKLGII